MKYFQLKRLLLTTTFTTFLAFLYPAHVSASLYLQGQVVKNGTMKSIDSVRVGSSRYKTVTWTDSKGRFILKKQPDQACLPETTFIDSSYYYKVHLSPYIQNRTIIEQKPRKHTISLCDLKGRSITSATINFNGKLFPQKKLANGIVLVSIDGKLASEALVLDNFGGNRLSKQLRISRVISHPFCPVEGDTIYFCKQGYRTVIKDINLLDSEDVVEMTEKRWVASDIHNHTLLTDGGSILDSVLRNGFDRFGLDLICNAEHGGSFSLDTAGIPIKSHLEHADAPSPYNNQWVPRWYSLIHFAWPKIINQRKNFPTKTLLLGLEWNNPSHEHSSVGFVSDNEQPEGIAEFEYRFDYNDTDTSKGSDKKANNAHLDAVSAMTWLQENYPATSYCFINHPSRQSSNQVWMFRDFHNAAPDVFLGMEGMPGHHKYYLRGKYGYNATIGGADPYIAIIGGLWDALLGEGRHLWIIVNSDFHSVYQDFWPGEYAKTWVTVEDTGAQAWLDGIKTGEIIAVHGDLIDRLEFSLDDGIHRATMGSDLSTSAKKLMLEIRFRSPRTNHNGDSIAVDHIDLIAGTISSKIDPQKSAEYSSPVNETTRLAARFDTDDWSLENGWHILRTELSFQQSTYFRLRGTSLGTETPGEFDNEGNPLPDERYGNNAAIAWRDIWFYSNPIFVYKK